MLSLIKQKVGIDPTVPVWFRSRQNLASEQIEKIPFPSNRQEHWKYLPMDNLKNSNFETLDNENNPDDPENLFQSILKDESYKIFLINGKVIKIDRRLNSFLKVNRFLDCLKLEENFYKALSKPETSDPFFYFLNTVMQKDGLLIEIPDNLVLDLPIHIIYLGSTKSLTVSSPNLIIQISSNSSVKLIEEFHDMETTNTLTNTVTHIEIGNDANVTHDRIVKAGTENYHFGQLNFELGKNAKLLSNSLAVDGKITRVDLNVNLNGKGSDCELKGLYLSKKECIVDHHTAIFHNSELTKSSELYRGIINGNGLGIFNGKVVVKKDISRISAKQYNNNLLLSDRASANTKPELQIHSDDVSCSHGATIGQLDTESLFYLRSRGIKKEEAQLLLIKGFTQEVLSENYQFYNEKFISNSLGVEKNIT